MTIDDIATRVRTLHHTIASDLCPGGNAGRLVCRSGCGREYAIEPSDVAQCLRKGWPRCCGREMFWNQDNEEQEATR